MGYGQTRSDWEARERAEKRLIEAVKANNLRVQRPNGKVFNISQNKYFSARFDSTAEMYKFLHEFLHNHAQETRDFSHERNAPLFRLGINCLYFL